MLNRLLLLVSLFCQFVVLAQNDLDFYSNRKALFTYFPKEAIKSEDPVGVQQFLESQFNCSLKLVKKSGNAVTTTYTFQQFHNNTEVYQGYAKVIADKNSKTILVLSSIYHGLPNQQNNTESSCWYFKNDGWVLGNKRISLNKEYSSLDEVITDANNNIISKRDLSLRNQEKDTTIRVRVFNTDPLTSAHKNYIAPYLDYNDSDVAVLNAQRYWKSTTCDFVKDTFWLRNQYLIPFKYGTNSFGPVFRKDTTFDYTRHQHEFEDVMVLYHLTKFQEHVNSLGFDTLGYRPMPYDAHAYTMDQSQYLPGIGLVFGTGGIDDAEDAQIITHEYCHALREFASPLSNNGLERQSLEEGFCDYFSTTYKMAIDSFGWRKWAFWDGNNPAQNWLGRDVASKKMYPQAISGDLWKNGEIWSSAMVRIYLKLGRTITDRLMLQTLYYLANDLSMTQTALLVIKADTTYYNGIHTDTLWNTFAETHILPWRTGIEHTFANTTPAIQYINSMQFMDGKADLKVLLPEFSKGNYTICNGLGQAITQGYFEGNNFGIAPALLPASGIYYLTITTPQFTVTRKLLMRL